MLFVVSGPWGVGKSECIKFMTDNYGFLSLIPWNTKTDENNRGTKYNLLLYSENGEFREYTSQELKDIKKNFVCPYARDYNGESTASENAEIGFWCQPFKDARNYQVLGYRVNEIMDVSNQNAVIIEADTDVAEQLKNASRQGAIGRVVNIFLDYETEETFKNRLYNEKTYTEPERHQKRTHRQKEVLFFKNDNLNKTDIFDFVIKSDIVEDICKQIVRYTTNLVRQTPNMLHNKPGALGGEDIKLAMSPKDDSKFGDIHIYIDRIFENEFNKYLGKDLFVNGCLNPLTITNASVDLFLSPICWTIGNTKLKKVDFVMGEESILYRLLKEKNLFKNLEVNSNNYDRIRSIVQQAREATIKKMFVEKKMNIKDGLLLQPNEIVLCSSIEKIELSDNIISFITSKYSFSQLGLSVNLNHNILQPGHKGNVMLQLKNNLPYPIVIYPYMRIAQIVFFRTISHCKHSSNTNEVFPDIRYQNEDAFISLSRNIIQEKNWSDLQLNQNLVIEEREKEKIDEKHHRNRLFYLTIFSAIISTATMIVNIIIKLLP